jgi:competence protein ComEA
MKNKEKIIGSIAILCISIVFIIVGYSMSNSNSKEDINAANYQDIFVETDKTIEKKDTVGVTSAKSSVIDDTNIKVDTNNIKVDIKGAVKYPGVYEIKKESRVTDLIKLAGGITETSDLDATNLSTKLNDEDCIVIYEKGQADKMQNVQNGTKSSEVLSGDDKSSTTININNASKEELNTLTGIGEVKADAIIKYREENGGFKSVEELTSVEGIGEKSLSKFIDKVDIK